MNRFQTVQKIWWHIRVAQIFTSICRTKHAVSTNLSLVQSVGIIRFFVSGSGQTKIKLQTSKEIMRNSSTVDIRRLWERYVFSLLFFLFMGIHYFKMWSNQVPVPLFPYARPGPLPLLEPLSPARTFSHIASKYFGIWAVGPRMKCFLVRRKFYYIVQWPSTDWTFNYRVFHKHTELAIMAILASVVLLRENKKSTNKMLTLWVLNLEPQPFRSNALFLNSQGMCYLGHH